MRTLTATLENVPENVPENAPKRLPRGGSRSPTKGRRTMIETIIAPISAGPVRLEDPTPLLLRRIGLAEDAAAQAPSSSPVVSRRARYRADRDLDARTLRRAG
jgi:hypothetical protein